MGTQAYERFESAVLEPIRDGRGGPLDVESVRQLDTADRRRAANELLRLLEQTEDVRAVAALGELCSQRAVRPLRTRLSDARGERREALDKALWLIVGTSESVAMLCAVAVDDPFWGHRMRAIIALGAFDDEDARGVLTAALRDEHALVRHHAGCSLAILTGRSKDEPEVRDAVGALMSRDEDERVRARQLVAAWLSETSNQ